MVYKTLSPNKLTFIGSGDLNIDISLVWGESPFNPLQWLLLQEAQNHKKASSEEGGHSAQCHNNQLCVFLFSMKSPLQIKNSSSLFQLPKITSYVHEVRQTNPNLV